MKIPLDLRTLPQPLCFARLSFGQIQNIDWIKELLKKNYVSLPVRIAIPNNFEYGLKIEFYQILHGYFHYEITIYNFYGPFTWMDYFFKHLKDSIVVSKGDILVYLRDCFVVEKSPEFRGQEDGSGTISIYPSVTLGFHSVAVNTECAIFDCS